MRSLAESSRANRKYLEMIFWAVLFVLAWELISGNLVSSLFLPPPSTVVNYLTTDFALKSLSQTVTILAVGFPLAVAIGMTMGFLINHYKTLYKSVYPFLFSVKAIPSSAIAILLVIWFGLGPLTKFVVVLYTGFFAVMVNTVGGLARIDYTYVEMMQSIQSSRLVIFKKLLFPNALPHIFTGIKNAAPSAIIGIIVVELFSGDMGLGFLFLMASAEYNVAMEFSALVWMGIVGLILFGIIIAVERLIHPWYLRRT